MGARLQAAAICLLVCIASLTPGEAVQGVALLKWVGMFAACPAAAATHCICCFRCQLLPLLQAAVVAGWQGQCRTRLAACLAVPAAASLAAQASV